MQQNGGRLRRGGEGDDLSPAGEAGVRGHLRLVCEALAAKAGPVHRAAFEELAEGAKEGEITRRGPEAVDDPVLVNQIGQAAMLQAHMRFLVEAVAATLPHRSA
jgi:hypothetical protein